MLNVAIDFLTKAIQTWLLILGTQAAVGRVPIVPIFFHFAMIPICIQSIRTVHSLYIYKSTLSNVFHYFKSVDTSLYFVACSLVLKVISRLSKQTGHRVQFGVP